MTFRNAAIRKARDEMSKASEQENKARHTAGPWRVIEGTGRRADENSYGVISDADGGVLVAEAYITGVEKPAKANANLIAAAPEMLDACIKAIACIDADRIRLRELNGGVLDDEDSFSTNEAIELLANAVAKAKGNQ